MSRFFSARLRKSVADVTRRKGRTLLVTLGIFIGVFGLTVINSVEDTLVSRLRVHARLSGDAARLPDDSGPAGPGAPARLCAVLRTSRRSNMSRS